MKASVGMEVIWLLFSSRDVSFVSDVKLSVGMEVIWLLCSSRDVSCVSDVKLSVGMEVIWLPSRLSHVSCVSGVKLSVGMEVIWFSCRKSISVSLGMSFGICVSDLLLHRTVVPSHLHTDGQAVVVSVNIITIIRLNIMEVHILRFEI